MCCTWVPCPNCLRALVDHKEIFGNSRIISVCGALEDEDDITNVEQIRRLFDDEKLGGFHGPYAKTSKSPGYGWIWSDVEVLESMLEQKALHRPGFGGVGAQIQKMIVNVIKMTVQQKIL